MIKKYKIENNYIATTEDIDFRTGTFAVFDDNNNLIFSEFAIIDICEKSITFGGGFNGFNVVVTW